MHRARLTHLRIVRKQRTTESAAPRRSARRRVRAALASLGLGLPPRHITVNLAAADVVKEGSHFDLPIALGLLAAMEALPTEDLAGYTALGEVVLDGSLTSVAGGHNLLMV